MSVRYVFSPLLFVACTLVFTSNPVSSTTIDASTDLSTKAATETTVTPLLEKWHQLALLNKKIEVRRQQLREARHTLVKTLILAKKHHRGRRHALTLVNEQISNTKTELKFAQQKDIEPLSKSLSELNSQATHAIQALELAAIDVKQLNVELKQTQFSADAVLQSLLKRREVLEQAIIRHPSDAQNQHAKGSLSVDNDHAGRQTVNGSRKKKHLSPNNLLISINGSTALNLESHLNLSTLLASHSFRHLPFHWSDYLKKSDEPSEQAAAVLVAQIIKQVRSITPPINTLVILGHHEGGAVAIKAAKAIKHQQNLDTDLLLLIDANAQIPAHLNAPLTLHNSRALPAFIQSVVNVWPSPGTLNPEQRPPNKVGPEGYLLTSKSSRSLQQPLFIDSAMMRADSAAMAQDKPLNPNEPSKMETQPIQRVQAILLEQVSMALPNLLLNISEGKPLEAMFTKGALEQHSTDGSREARPYPKALRSYASEADNQSTLKLTGRALISRCHAQITFIDDTAYLALSVPNRRFYHELFLYNPKAILFNSLGQPLFHDQPTDDEYVTAFENGHLKMSLTKETLRIRLNVGEHHSPTCKFKL